MLADPGQPEWVFYPDRKPLLQQTDLDIHGLPIFVYQIAQRTKKTEEYLGRILSLVALEASGRNRKPARPPLKQHKKIKSDGFISG